MRSCASTDWALAQALADTLSPDQLHRYAKLYCPVSDVFGQSYHWRVEYATDLAFRSAATLGPLYGHRRDPEPPAGRINTSGSAGATTGIQPMLQSLSLASWRHKPASWHCSFCRLTLQSSIQMSSYGTISKRSARGERVITSLTQL